VSGPPGPRADRFVQLGVLQPRADEVGAPEHRLAQVGFHQAGFPHPAVGQVDAAQVGAAEHREREIHLDQLHRPHAALGEHRAEKAAVAEGAVPQRCTSKLAIAERRPTCSDFGHVDTAEVAFGEHDALGA
jgi:hypothetical protein